MNPFSFISFVFVDALIFVWDFFLTLGNLILFRRPVGKVTPKGHPGYGGQWPEYIPPQEGDSRSCCPGLNAMANHGILPRSGRGIKFTDVPPPTCATFNFSTSLATFLTLSGARMLKRNYKKDTFDLEELNLHNGIEHDGSLTRLDTALQPDQSVIHPPCVEELLSSATGEDAAGNPLLTIKDVSRVLRKRRIESKAMNKDYSLRIDLSLIGASNSSMVVHIFGSPVNDLRAILSEERLPQGWESKTRSHYGQTSINLGLHGLQVELRSLFSR